MPFYAAKITILSALLLITACSQLQPQSINVHNQLPPKTIEAPVIAITQTEPGTTQATETTTTTTPITSPISLSITNTLPAKPTTSGTSGNARRNNPTAINPSTINTTTNTEAAPENIKSMPKDVWERIRLGFALPAMETELVRTWEGRYLAKPEYIGRMVDRSSQYLFHIIEEIERRKMPAEIALLPMIESAYNPEAYSSAHASGLWQFIPSTGKLYGLRQNWWYDGRRDVIAATSAALDYLEKLYVQFGDWELALASYNWGEGAVARAIARNQARSLPTNYASLTMPAETRNYLPKLIAVKNIINDPARYGIHLASIPNTPYFEVVNIQRHIDIKMAAKFADMTLEQFKFLNPAHNKQVIKANTESIILPKNKVATFLANVENNDKPLVSWQAHTVNRGEKPEKIAAQYGISVNELKQVNNLSSNNKFYPGQSLLVPTTEGVTPNLPDLPVAPMMLPRAYQAAPIRHTNLHTKNGKQLRNANAIKASKRALPHHKNTGNVKSNLKQKKIQSHSGSVQNKR